MNNKENINPRQNRNRTPSPKRKGRTLTIDIVAMEYLNFCKQSGKRSLFYNTLETGYLPIKNEYGDLSFRNFMQVFDELIPFSLYQKINQDKLMEWCNKK